VTFVGNSGRVVAVGSGTGNSAVHIYSKSDNQLWELLTTISLPSSEQSSFLFGASLDSNSDGYIVVGAPYWSGKLVPGAAYVYMPNFDFTDWYLAAKLNATEGVFAPTFGISVAFNGHLIAVGSPDERNGKGSAYIFERTVNSWDLSVKLSPDTEVAERSQFGWSVSLYGQSPAALAVGAPRDAGGGSALVYTRFDKDWQVQKLTPPDVEEGDDFGSSVVISGCTIAVISANDRTASTTGAGSVRIFNWNPNYEYWTHSQIEPGEIFAQCIAIEGNTLLIGSPAEGEGGEKSGVIHHFRGIDGLTKISTIPNRDHVSGDEDKFGCPLSLSGGLSIAGSRGDSTLGSSSGSAFIYDLCPDK